MQLHVVVCPRQLNYQQFVEPEAKLGDGQCEGVFVDIVVYLDLFFLEKVIFTDGLCLA
jgi:hypothetical protein